MRKQLYFLFTTISNTASSSERMAKKITLLCLLILSTLTIFAIDNDKDTGSPNSAETKTRSFKESDDILKSNSFQYQPEVSEFTEEYINQYYTLDSVTNDQIIQARAVMNNLEVSQNYVDLVSPDDLVTLPIGIKKEIGNITYTLGISKALITPEYTEVTAFVRIIIPQSNAQGNQKQLFFGANNIKLSHKGGIYGDANLVLLGDVPIPINGGNAMIVLNGGFDMNKGNVTNRTYVTVNCDGFKELAIDADLLFPRKMLEPVDKNYKVIPKKQVKAHFNSKVADWNDILIDVSIPPFQIAKENSSDGKGKAGLIFEINTAVFDFSDLNNSADMVFPKDYAKKYLISGSEKLWRGVYVKSFLVVLPKQFKKRKTTKRLSFEASNLLIDNMGISGKFLAHNVLPINEGEASGWQFSVDHFRASFEANKLVGAGFDGNIVLPITNPVTEQEMKDKNSKKAKQKMLSYIASIDIANNEEEYKLTVKSLDSLSFDVFKAKAILASNSYVELKVSEGQFEPKAVLNGSLGITAGSNNSDSKKAIVNFKGIIFQNLQLQTKTPYFQVDYFGYQGKVQFANFPVTISEIGATIDDKSAGLHFSIGVNLMKSGFAGETSISIWGKLTTNELSSWQYEKLELRKLSVKADMGVIQIKGSIDFKNDDPTYGNGFFGELEATFNGIKVSASSWFGKTTFRYWYVDAYLDLSGSLAKVYIGPVIVNGFGGGAYYHMSKAPGTYSSGVPTGQNYQPSKTTGLGFRALIGFALVEEKAFNGKVGFEMEFNTKRGINRILFFGEAHIIKALDFKFGDKFKDKLTKMEDKINGLGKNNAIMNKLKESNLVDYSKVSFPQDGLTFDMGIDANFSMEMDIKNNSFHAEMEIFVNTPGGFFQGVGPKGRAGWAVFHTSENEWYLYIGTPKDPTGLKLGLGKFRIEAKFYLMIGDKIPGSPPPPEKVAKILGVELGELDSMRELNNLGEGKGFAIGASFDFDTGDMSFLMFYASFNAGFGFDIMIKNYKNTVCKGSGQIGIDGWYANGQSYAYLQGELGIKIRLFAIRKNIAIISGSGAMLLQAKLPNPSWFRGYLAGEFNLLGGLVKGSYNFKVEVGQECEFVNSGPLDGLKIISDIKPSNSTQNVDVYTDPQVAFNMKINTPFEFEDDEGIGIYRILLDEYTVTSKEIPIIGNIEWNTNNNVVNFVPTEILPPNSSIRIKVEVSFQQKINGNWSIMKQDGKPAKETKEVTFTTGEAPDYIPLSDIIYNYPLVDQTNFYAKERNSGYIKIEKGRPDLFAPVTDWTQVALFESETERLISKDVSYNRAKNEVSFGFPELKKGMEYTFKILSSPPPTKGSKQPGEETYTQVDTQQEGNTVEVRNTEALEEVKDSIAVEVISYNFTTSNHDTFAEKIDSMLPVTHFIEIITNDVSALKMSVKPFEKFSLEELNGNEYTNFKPMVRSEAILVDKYYTSKIYPLVYKDYPIEPKFIVSRDTTLLGMPPKRGVELLTWYSSYFEVDPSHNFLKTRVPFMYNLSFYYKKDFIDIQYEAVNAYYKDPDKYKDRYTRFNNLINSTFPYIQKGDYPVKMTYVLPGEIEGSSATLIYKKP